MFVLCMSQFSPPNMDGQRHISSDASHVATPGHGFDAQKPETKFAHLLGPLHSFKIMIMYFVEGD